MEWSVAETSKHQDHVIAHVIGAKVLAYFIWDEVAHLLLDMDFLWSIFVDGEMSLLPWGVAVGELDLETGKKEELRSDVELIRASHFGDQRLLQMTVVTPFAIDAVELFSREQQRLVVLSGEDQKLELETFPETGDLRIREVRA